MSKQIYVQVQADHIASFAKSAPVAAIEELVWNALDADAREVRVDLIVNQLGAVEAVRVADDGTGVDVLRADATFGFLALTFHDLLTRCHAFARLVDTRLSRRHGSRIGTHRALDSDMSHTAVNALPLISTAHHLLQCLVVRQVLRRCLSTITLELLDKRSRRVYTAMLGFRYLQLEVHEQIQILFHRFLAAGCLLAVLFVNVLELRQHNRLAVNRHQHLVFLRLCTQYAQCRSDCN